VGNVYKLCSTEKVSRDMLLTEESCEVREGGGRNIIETTQGRLVLCEKLRRM
jgi:hypothetical protein